MARELSAVEWNRMQGKSLQTSSLHSSKTGTEMDLPMLLRCLAHAVQSCLGPPGEVEREQCCAIAHTGVIIAL